MSENRTENVPVLIVGGGGAGLTMSTALSLRGIPSILINMRPGTSVLPKAHVLNQRTMEIFTELGVAEEIYARTCPPENMRYTGWYAGLNGDREHFGRQLGKLEAWGGGYSDPDYIAASPCATSNLPQIRLEPLLLARAEEVGADGSVRFNHELTALEVREDGVSATIADHNDGSTYTIEAKYLIAADGGRTVGRMLGIGMTGPTDLQKMISIHMTADLKPWLPDDEVLIRWFVNPDFGGSWSGVLVAMGPDHWGGSSEEWVFHMQYATDDPDAMQEERVLERMRATLGLSDHQFEVHKISSWVLEGVIADEFRRGPVFLIGDAAHRHPPTGGLGLNSAVHDAYNLQWKLAAVLSGQASEELLDTYETERRPVDQHNVDNALRNAMNHFTIDQALGVSPDQSGEENWEALMPLWESRPDSVEKRHALNTAIDSQTMEFRHHNVEFGYTYESTAIVTDGSPAPAALDETRLYVPSTRPGHPLPHAFVEREGDRVPLGSLVAGEFLVIAGEDGHDWIRAAETIDSELGVPVRGITVGVLEGDYIDVRAAWLKQREIGRAGAIVVRPDRYIAYRSSDGVADPARELREVFGRITAQRTPESQAV